MASRWSEPSFSQGVQRFRVWPLGSDKYNHAEFAANWDKVDALFGSPPDGNWPKPGGIYREIKIASDEAIPLGMLFPWFRPSLTVPIPSGYEVADGRTLGPSEHSFPGGGNVTIPDLRNRFVLGADYNKEIGDPGTNSDTGAPGPQGKGGANAIALTKDQLPIHKHTGSMTGWSPAIATWYFQSSTYDAQKNTPDPERIAPIYAASENFDVVLWGKGVSYSAGAGGYALGQHRHTLSSVSSIGSGTVHENRPMYIGMIWLIKVKNNG